MSWKAFEHLDPEERSRAQRQFQISSEPGDDIREYEFSFVGEAVWRRLMRIDGAAIPSVPLPDYSERDRVIEVPLASLHDSPFQPRTTYDEKKLSELAESIKGSGILQPLLARRRQDGEIELVYGHRRRRAAALAGLSSAPTIIRELTDGQVQEIQFIENIHRDDLDPIDEAEGLRMMLALRNPDHTPKYTLGSLAERLGKKSGAKYVSNKLRLLRLPEKGKQAVKDGRLEESTAYLIAKVPSPELRKKLTAEVLKGFGDGPLSRRETEQHIRRSYTVELRNTPFDQQSAKLVPVQEQDGERVSGGACTDCPHNSRNMEGGDQQKFAMCTLPTCFQAKVDANVEEVKQRALKEGAVVVQGDQARRLVYHDGTPMYDSGLINIDRQPDPADLASTGGKVPSWKKMVFGKSEVSVVMDRDSDGNGVVGKVKEDVTVPVTVVIDDRGKAHRLVPRKVAIEAARKNGYDSMFKGTAGRGKSAAQEAESSRKAQEEAQKKQQAAISYAAMEELVIQVGAQGVTPAHWPALLDIALFHSGVDAMAFVCHRRKLEVPKNECNQPDRDKALRNHFKELSVDRIPGFIIEVLLAGWMRFSGIGAPGFPPLAAAYGLDVNAIERRVKAELAESQGKPKPKASAKKAKESKEEPRSVREHILELATPRALDAALLDRLSLTLVGISFQDAKGSELNQLLEAVRDWKELTSAERDLLPKVKELRAAAGGDKYSVAQLMEDIDVSYEVACRLNDRVIDEEYLGKTPAKVITPAPKATKRKAA